MFLLCKKQPHPNYPVSGLETRSPQVTGGGAILLTEPQGIAANEGCGKQGLTKTSPSKIRRGEGLL